jgi:hypothetical protein
VASLLLLLLNRLLLGLLQQSTGVGLQWHSLAGGAVGHDGQLLEVVQETSPAACRKRVAHMLRMVVLQLSSSCLLWQLVAAGWRGLAAAAPPRR